MGVASLIFDPIAALTGLKAWCEFVLSAHYTASEIRRGRRNAPANSQRQVTVIPLTPTPIAEGWTDNKIRVAQRNQILVTVTAAAAGLYSLRVLGANADYVAGGGDDEEAIRDGLAAAVVALAFPVTVANSGDEAFTVQHDTAGVWLAPEVLSGALSVATLDDVMRVGSSMPSRWTLRIIVDDIRPASGHSSVTEAAALLEQYLSAGTVPIVDGSAAQYADDLLSNAGLMFHESLASVVGDYTTGGTGTGGVRPTLYHERAALDVVFRVTKGLEFDQPTIESFGAPGVTFSDP